MPETLNELAVRCKKEEKDLFMYYYLSKKTAESTIIFCNSITCTKRVSSILTSMKIPNQCLHSKMQQRARLKSLDRFKTGVAKIEDAAVEIGKAKTGPQTILVCTDVAARGLDIPNVNNVLHY
jgi:ATP-dependent RNA helicase DDX24/MAK5